MPDYSQADQPIRVDTVLGEDVLLPEALTGEEALSKPFLFTVDLVSEDSGIDGEELLRSELRIDLDLPGGGARSIHGIVRRFVQRGRERDLISYRAEVVPWFWFLSLATDSRIFQEMDVLAIVEEVFQGQGYSDFEIRCTRSYQTRAYTVQYRESNLNFVSRLLEDEGIFYFFEHTESKHILVLADDMSAIKPCEGQPEARMYSKAVPDEDVVTSIEREHAVHPGAVTLGDYDYLQPSLTLRSTVTGNEPEEVYDHPAGFDAPDGGDHRARVALEREEARRHMVRGSGTCRGFMAGGRFDLVDHFQPDADQTYALLEIRHQARNAAYRGESHGGGMDYRNDFVAMPHGVPYRPPLRTRKPTVKGAQTAEVVGPSGEPIWVDKHSRVKVHFHWDRLGSRDEKSSCWVRVSQNWAGKQWGGMFIPHIGQEVIVDFLEGDPDRPIITGRVYNAEQTPPQELPANQHKSIIEDDFGNEMVFDATPGDEHIRIHSPSHSSTVEIGKSILLTSLSNFVTHIKGNEGFVTEGASLGGHIGFKATADLAGTLGVFMGFKLDIDVSQRVGVTFGPSYKWSKGEEYSAGGSDFTKHVAGKVILNSDEELFLIGGDKDQSVVDGTAKALSLQYGAAATADMIKPDAKMKFAVAAGTIAGVTGAMLSTQAWEGVEKEGKTDSVRWSHLGGSGLIGVVPPAALALMKHFSNRKKSEKTFPAIHTKVYGKLRLSEKGVALGAYNGTSKSPVSHAALFGTGGHEGKAQIGAKKKVEIKSRMVVINGKSEVQVKAPKVRATKGSFWTKNIKDNG